MGCKRIGSYFIRWRLPLSATYAQMVRKEIILETGKGGVELKVSVPDFANGPMGWQPRITKVDVNFHGINVKGQQVAHSLRKRVIKSLTVRRCPLQLETR